MQNRATHDANGDARSTTVLSNSGVKYMRRWSASSRQLRRPVNGMRMCSCDKMRMRSCDERLTSTWPSQRTHSSYTLHHSHHTRRSCP
jgi:hypothetical protein